MVSYRLELDDDDLWAEFKSNITKNETIDEKFEELIRDYVEENRYIIQNRDDLYTYIDNEITRQLDERLND